jgi:hypothetical protein
VLQPFIECSKGRLDAREAHLLRGHGRIPLWIEKEWREEKVTFSQHQEVSKGHGRQESRTVWALVIRSETDMPEAWA